MNQPAASRNPSPEVDARAAGTTADASTAVRRRFARSRFLMPIVLFALIAAVWLGYTKWLTYRAAALKEACESDQAVENWEAMRQHAMEWAELADAGDGEPYVFAASAAFELNDLEGACELLGQVPDQWPRAVKALVEKENLEWTHLNQPLRGIETTERIIRLEPRYLPGHARLISFYAMTLQRPKMREAIASAIESRAEPKEAYVYLMLSDSMLFTNADDMNQRWRASAPNEEVFQVGLAVHTALQLSQEAESTATRDAQEMEAEAVRRLEDFLELYPQNPVLLSFLLDFYTEDGNIERTGELLQHVTDAVSDEHVLWIARGWYFAATDNLSEANSSLEKAVELMPLSVRAHHELASVRRRMGDASAEQEQQIAVEGRALRKELLQLPNAREVTWTQLSRIRDYAAKCEAHLIADTLTQRLADVGMK